MSAHHGVVASPVVAEHEEGDGARVRARRPWFTWLVPRVVLRFSWRGRSANEAAFVDVGDRASWIWPAPTGAGLEVRAVWGADTYWDDNEEDERTDSERDETGEL